MIRDIQQFFYGEMQIPLDKGLCSRVIPIFLPVDVFCRFQQVNIGMEA